MTNYNSTKVSVGAVAGAVSVLAVWVATVAGLDVPAEAASAFTVVVTAAISLLTPAS
jgi:uncharacterized membrane protein